MRLVVLLRSVGGQKQGLVRQDPLECDMRHHEHSWRFFCGFLLIATGCLRSAGISSIAAQPAHGVVHPLFDLTSPERSPFPSDRFTVTDPGQNTGRRVNLPMPDDCIANASDCDDVAVLNRLDGFNIRTRLSIPFDGDIDPTSVTSESVFLISLGDVLDVVRCDRVATRSRSWIATMTR